MIGCMDCQWWSSTPARGPQDGPNVLHGLSLSQSQIFCIRPGFTDETIFVLHEFGFQDSM
jgi:hypothetical protein